MFDWRRSNVLVRLAEHGGCLCWPPSRSFFEARWALLPGWKRPLKPSASALHDRGAAWCSIDAPVDGAAAAIRRSSRLSLGCQRKCDRCRPKHSLRPRSHLRLRLYCVAWTRPHPPVDNANPRLHSTPMRPQSVTAVSSSLLFGARSLGGRC